MKRFLKRMLFGSRPRMHLVRRGLLRGLHFHVDPNHKAQRLIGFDEREICGIIKSYAGRVKTAVDIGANDGWYTLYFATQSGIEKVIACEPDSACLPRLRENLLWNSKAVTADVSIVQKYVGRGPSERWITVDTLLSEVSGPCLLKIDVDGGELEVLLSGEQTINKHSPYLIVETHSKELETNCIRLLSQTGYACCIVPNGWYRGIIPELRPIPHNRWFYAHRKTNRA